MWNHRAQLNTRDRTNFLAQAGWRYGASSTEAEVITQWDSITRTWPEYKAGWSEFGEELLLGGSVAGVPNWLERSRDVLERITRVKGTVPWRSLHQAAAAAAYAGDLATMQAYVERWAAVPAGRNYQLTVYEWRLATLKGDSAAAEQAFQSLGATRADAYRGIPVYGLTDGRGIADGERAGQLTDTWRIKPIWARARGRHGDWIRWRDGLESPLRQGMMGVVLRLRDALFLGEPEDSAVRGAARYVSRIAAGNAISAPDGRDRAIALCWSTVWRLAHGDAHGARSAARYLGEEVALPYHLPVCAGLIEVMSTKIEGGDLRAAVRRWNAIVRPAPLPVYDFGEDPNVIVRDGTLGLDNLLLARFLVQVGDTNAALAAAKRRFYYASFLGRLLPGSLLVDALREEGRLAAMTGDTAEAIGAYNHYLALRENPDYEPWRQERDQVRRELAALVRER